MATIKMTARWPSVTHQLPIRHQTVNRQSIFLPSRASFPMGDAVSVCVALPIVRLLCLSAGWVGTTRENLSSEIGRRVAKMDLNLSSGRAGGLFLAELSFLWCLLVTVAAETNKGGGWVVEFWFP